MPTNGKTAGESKSTPHQKKKYRREPTTRQERLKQLLVEKGRKKPIGTLMREAGYSKAYSLHPIRLKRSASWKEIMDAYFPDDKLAEIHRIQLNSTRRGQIKFPVKMTNKQIIAEVQSQPGMKVLRIQRERVWAYCTFLAPDTVTRDAALDKAYKLKGSYHVDKKEGDKNEALEEALNKISALLPDSK